MIIPSLETWYNGCKFRSRLEARWAIFFDAIGCVWEYEKEPIWTPRGNYLPDFYLPQVGMWAEVKPEEFTEEEAYKVYALSMSTNKEVLFLVGVPTDRPFRAASPEIGVYGITYVLTGSSLCDGKFDTSPHGYFTDVSEASKKAINARFDNGIYSP